ncbi:MAG: potassium-transporting ATPase subunit KdpB, partial [Phycisphaerae bacterium]|nr:potassium-transporting ATPase subunit KdpB [Phycisphaerae bacterium]
MTEKATTRKLLDWAIIRPAILDSFRKLDPRRQAHNPVMFVVFVGSILTSLLFIQSLYGHGEASPRFILGISLWLWFTVLFANFAEAVAEGRGKAQADALRDARQDVHVLRLRPEYVVVRTRDRLGGRPPAEQFEAALGSMLRKGDVVFVHAGQFIPGDGEVIEGAASVDESAITGESAPVIRESGGDRSSVTGGTKVLSDWLLIRVTADPGETFLDRMIAMVEGAKRRKTPNEIALNILLAALTMIFLVVCATLLPYSLYSVRQAGRGTPVTITVLVALLVCLAPTTIGALLSAIGIAGMNRLAQANVVAMSGRAVEAAGDVDVLLLDKTGTITFGNRQAVDFVLADGASVEELVEAAQLASLSDETPEGRSIVVLAKRFGLRGRDLGILQPTFVPFSARTRMSGVDVRTPDGQDRKIRKGAADAIEQFVASQGGRVPAGV